MIIICREDVELMRSDMFKASLVVTKSDKSGYTLIKNRLTGKTGKTGGKELEVLISLAINEL